LKKLVNPRLFDCSLSLALGVALGRPETRDLGT
jgi:hypothetical protein